jgi:N-acetylglucosamine kinase-like BadF-type ATPase
MPVGVRRRPYRHVARAQRGAPDLDPVSMRLFLAVDGGNSKTDVVLGTTDGEVLAFLRGPGSSPQMLGVSEALRLLNSLVERSRALAGLPAGMTVAQASLFLAGVDLPVEAEQLSGAVASHGWAQRHVVDNDTFALLRAGTSLPDAVAVVCGTGINCVGRATDGRITRFLSLGQISGDWGGGRHLADLAVWHAVRGEDGRGPATALSRAVADHFGQSTVEGAIIAIHLGKIPRERVFELSPVLFAVAAAGDAVARGVVRQQADEVVALARVAADRLDLRHTRHAVVLGGGVLQACHPLLTQAVLDGVREYSDEAEVTVVSDAPVAGAALLALDALGVTPQVEQVLRTALRRPPTVVDESATA